VLAHGRFVDLVPDAVAWNERNAGPGVDRTFPNADDVAVIQFSSGTTGQPKGAVLTHRAILAALRASATAYDLRAGADTLAAWLPLFHDNGLFGFLVRPLVVGCPVHLMPTERFARDPAEWFRMLTNTGATF